MEAGDSVEIRFDTTGCFHHEEAIITITRTVAITRMDHFEARVVRERGDEPIRVDMSDHEIAQLDELLAYYRTLEGSNLCTTTIAVGLLWKGPTILPYIEPFTDATCDAPEAGHSVLHRLVGLLGGEAATPSNKRMHLTVTPLADARVAPAGDAQR